MQTRNYTIFALIGVIVVAIASAGGGFRGFEFQEELPQKVLGHMLALVFFALLIERAVEVIVNDRFIKREMKVNSATALLKRKGAMLQTTLDLELQRPAPAMTDANAMVAANVAKNDIIDELRQLIRQNKKEKIDADQNAMPERVALSAEKTRYAAMTAIILGGLFAVSGVTILAEFVVLPDPADVGQLFGFADQLEVFAAVDILLTAVILAGGSEGIHQIIKRFLDVRDDTSNIT